MNTIKFWAVFAIGVAAGASVALIYAPQAGEKTRRQLRDNLDDAGEYIRDAADTFSSQAEKAIKRGKEAYEDALDSAGSVAKKARQAVS